MTVLGPRSRSSWHSCWREHQNLPGFHGRGLKSWLPVVLLVDWHLFHESIYAKESIIRELQLLKSIRSLTFEFLKLVVGPIDRRSEPHAVASTDAPSTRSVHSSTVEVSSSRLSLPDCVKASASSGEPSCIGR